MEIVLYSTAVKVVTHATCMLLEDHSSFVNYKFSLLRSVVINNACGTG